MECFDMYQRSQLASSQENQAYNCTDQENFLGKKQKHSSQP